MYRRKDRHVEANSCFSQFCESVFGVFRRKVEKTSTSLHRIQQLENYWQDRVEVKICAGTSKYFIFFLNRNKANTLYEEYMRFTYISNVTSWMFNEVKRIYIKVKGKVIPLQARCGPDGG